MELSPTAYVILGMLGWRPMSGYEIKSIVDKSTRFFWAASYGQIYPELRRLVGRRADRGQGGSPGRAASATCTGSPRPAAGSSGLARTSTPEVFELRDEGLLKLFFADGDRRRSRRSGARSEAPRPRARRRAPRGDRGDRATRRVRVHGPALRDRVQPVDGRLVRAHDARAGGGAGRRERRTA